MAAVANAKRERFCQEYLVDLNAGRAYERAGYKARGRVADAAASRLLADVSVAARIAELQAERAERVQVTVDDVVAGLLTEAQKDDNPGAARVSAWAHLGKHLGMFGPKGTADDPVNHAVLIRRVNQRAHDA